jgi:CRP-like cAMP-binding protein
MELEGFKAIEGIELVQKTALFRRLSFEETNRLAAIAEAIDLEPGATVIEENALGDALYLIISGQVRVSRDANRDGAHSDREQLGTLGAGELFGEMSLVDDLLTSARITALERCRVLKIPRRRFEQLLEEDEKLALKVYKAFCQTLSERLRRANILLHDTTLQASENR